MDTALRFIVRLLRRAKAAFSGGTCGASALPELLLVSKPRGITSFDVIRRLRRRYGKVKMGHAGTLDPMAEGLMIIGVGKGTKRLSGLIGLDKTYEADITLGLRTDTGDMDGAIVEERRVGEPRTALLESVLRGLVGDVALKVPAYSALKRGGEPLYKKARRGEAVETPVRIMKIRSAKLLGSRIEDGRPVVSVRMRVGSGTYVRSIAEEFGRRLGVPATLSRLVRTSVGKYGLEDAEKLEA